MSEDIKPELSQYELEMRAKYGKLDLVQLAIQMGAIQAEKERIDEMAKAVGREFDWLRLNAIPGKMDEEGIANIKVSGLGQVKLTGDMYVSVLAENRPKVYEFFRDHNRGDIISESINAATLKATVKDMFKKGEEIPEDLIKVTPFTRASITREKSKTDKLFD
jgi:hypothetical protein